jgi:hypothetical protein
VLNEMMQRVDLKKWNSWDESLKPWKLNSNWKVLLREELWQKDS